MYAIPLMMLGALLSTLYLSVALPTEFEQFRAVSGDVAATNFWSYRNAVVQYVQANPTIDGSVVDSKLSFEPGFLRCPDWWKSANPACSAIASQPWNNFVSNGKLFIYSTTSINTAMYSSNTAHAIAAQAGMPVMVGIAQPSGTMTSVTDDASEFALPTAMPAIPQGAIVVVGR